MECYEVEKIVSKLKRYIDNEMRKANYNNALSLISMCASVLYQTNLYYMDKELEEMLCDMAQKMKLGKYGIEQIGELDDEKLLFFDGFGYNNRGLIQIYLKALCRMKRVIYVTYEDRKEEIPDVIKILNEYQCESIFIERKKISYLPQVFQLDKIIKSKKPGHFFFYSLPDDAASVLVMNAYFSIVRMYQINLTDHAFWLGARCIDDCIEFREYGAKISNEYREISEQKITVIPFYPVVDYDMPFAGFPFDTNFEQRVIFSGGALYKTYGGNNKYYEIVDYILSRYPDAVFWYAGSGDDTEIRKVMLRYPNRVYLTQERKDLFQVLQHCYFYLSTYPICGGLMFQYAALAGKCPVTLKNGNISDDFLINQDSLHIEFTDIESVKREIDCLMTDSQYAKEKGELLKKAVMSEEQFEKELRNVIERECKKTFVIQYRHIETEDFRNIYLERLTEEQVNLSLFRSKNYILLKYEPLRLIRGFLAKIKKKICAKC